MNVSLLLQRYVDAIRDNSTFCYFFSVPQGAIAIGRMDPCCHSKVLRAGLLALLLKQRRLGNVGHGMFNWFLALFLVTGIALSPANSLQHCVVLCRTQSDEETSTLVCMATPTTLQTFPIFTYHEKEAEMVGPSHICRS